MARTYSGYSLDRHDKKIAGVCSTLGDVFSVDPTFIRVAFVAAAILVSWKLALVAYVAAGLYLSLQRNGMIADRDRRNVSDFDRMEQVGSIRPSIKAMRTELDQTDRRMMAIDDHINSQNDELAREIEALREDK